jgi:amino acid adenylation domain-containing protein
LDELPPGPQLPMTMSPTALREPRFVRFEVFLEAPLWRRLKDRIFQAGLTPNGFLLAAYAEILGRWSRSRRFTLNVPRFNRLPLHGEVDLILGEFASFTLISVDVDPARTFLERAREVQRRLWEGVDHGLFSGVDVLRELRRRAGSALEAMMPVVFTCDPLGESGAEDAGTLIPEELGRNAGGVSQTAQVWLDNQVSQQNGRLMVVWDAVESLFPPGLLAEMFDSYRNLLERLADDGSLWQERRIELLSDEHLAWLAARDAPSAPVPEGRIHDAFFAQARQRPERPAVLTAERSYSYGEIASFATRLGHLLREGGARPGELVAVVMEKGWEQVGGVLGVLAAGAAYMPVDALMPRERLWKLLAQAEVRFVLTQSKLDASLAWPPGLVRLPLDTLDLEGASDEPLAPVASADDLAYVIFTSGSTGVPKGAMLAHRGVLNMVHQTARHWGIGEGDRTIALTALHHDLSVYDLFGPLSVGGAVVMPEASKRLDPAHWSELLRMHQVTVWNTVPSILEMLLRWVDGRAERLSPSLSLVVLGGDWVPVSLPDRLRTLVPGARVLSIGGPTETTVWNIWYPVGEVDPSWTSIPYGRPFENNGYRILGEDLEPCPRWVTGTMYCSGVQLAQGYWRDAERTAASFFDHPATGERLYRTGDLGRWLPDGNIEFLGREDFQVKIQGHRIELGEIETALRALAGVGAAIVQARADEPTSGSSALKRLVAYVVATPGSELAPAELRARLRERLPEYMVPAVFVPLAELPLTSNGKVDRARLPSPKDVAGAEARRSVVGGTPSTGLETAISTAWSEVLGHTGFGVAENFFDLGGNSFLMIQVQGKLRERLGREISVAELFQYTTVRGLAEHLSQGEEASAEVARGRERAEIRRGALRGRVRLGG